MLRLTRKVAFTAGHIYRGGGLSEAELKSLFGVAAETSGHGHNYVWELTVAGEVDPVTGMVVNIKDIDGVMREIIAPLDHRLVNLALPEFADNVPTTERLAQVLWSRLPARIGSSRCVEMRLEEHPGLHVEIFGGDPMVYLTRAIEFAASHRLHAPALSDEENQRIFGKCNNLHGHGHNYVAEITVRGEPDPRSGIVADLGKLDALLESEIEARFDHKHLNFDTPYFKTTPATAENIAQVIWTLVAPHIAACREGGAVALHRVRLIETARSWFDYYGA